MSKTFNEKKKVFKEVENEISYKIKENNYPKHKIYMNKKKNQV